MKAPISQRVKEILSNEKTAEKLISSVIKKKKTTDDIIIFGDKYYQLQKITSTRKH